jgi:hypothetical protein
LLPHAEGWLSRLPNSEMRALSRVNRALGITNLTVSLFWAIAAFTGTSRQCGDYPFELPWSAIATNTALLAMPSAVVLVGCLVSRRGAFIAGALLANLFLLAIVLAFLPGTHWPDCLPERESSHLFLALGHDAVLAAYLSYVAAAWIVLVIVRCIRLISAKSP